MRDKTTVFLGGTCGKNTWRDDFIERLVARGVPREALFNPVVPDWNAEVQAREDKMKADPSVMLMFYLGDTKDEVDMYRGEGDTGNYFLSFYSLHEAEMSLYDAPERTAIVIDPTGIVPRAAKRMQKVCSDLQKRFPGHPIFGSLEEAEDWIVKNFAAAKAA